VYDLASGAHDRADADGLASRVRRSYLLCSMPRSGSSLLSEGLAALGRLGTPIEYFDGTGAFRWLWERWGCRDLDEYVTLLHHRRVSEDGVFGAKLHWFHVEELAGALGVDERAAVDRVFPRCRFVHVRRRDRVRQAVSWAVARQTGRWSDGAGVYPGTPPPPVYSFEAIDECRAALGESERRWRAFFEGVGASVLDVAYEDLVADHGGTVAAVSRYLGEPVEPSAVPPPRLRRQSDDRTEEMVERYLAELAGRGGPADLGGGSSTSSSLDPVS
jgi:trehalose 2-sulfotransferase